MPGTLQLGIEPRITSLRTETTWTPKSSETSRGLSHFRGSSLEGISSLLRMQKRLAFIERKAKLGLFLKGWTSPAVEVAVLRRVTHNKCVGASHPLAARAQSLNAVRSEHQLTGSHG